MVVLQKKSRDHQSRYHASSGDLECLYAISSLATSCRNVILDQSGGQKIIAIPIRRAKNGLVCILDLLEGVGTSESALRDRQTRCFSPFVGFFLTITKI